MTDLAYFVVIDRTSGTFFDADNAFLLDTRKLSDDELDTLNNGTDDERGALAERLGVGMKTIDMADQLAARGKWKRKVSKNETSLGYEDWLLQQYYIRNTVDV